MSVHKLSIFNEHTVPEDASGIFPERVSVKATTTPYNYLVFIFPDDSVRKEFEGAFFVPENYLSVVNPFIEVFWTTNAITGDVEWDFDYKVRAADDVESIDVAGNDESVNQNDTAPSAAFEVMRVVLTLTGSNIVKNDFMAFKLAVDGTDAGNTIASYVMLLGARFVFEDV